MEIVQRGEAEWRWTEFGEGASVAEVERRSKVPCGCATRQGACRQCSEFPASARGDRKFLS